MGWLVLPEIDKNLLGLVDVQDQIFRSAPVHHMADLSKGQLVIVSDEAHHRCVIRKLYNVIGKELCAAVMDHDG